MRQDIPPVVVAVFERYGFSYGGVYRGAKDTMHFDFRGDEKAAQDLWNQCQTIGEDKHYENLWAGSAGSSLGRAEIHCHLCPKSLLSGRVDMSKVDKNMVPLQIPSKSIDPTTGKVGIVNPYVILSAPPKAPPKVPMGSPAIGTLGAPTGRSPAP